MANAATGRLMKKTDPHQKCSSSQPPVSGPTAPPTPAKAAQIPMARARSCGLKTLARIESVAGMTRAAAAPMSARQAMICAGLLANAARPDPAPNTSSPVVSAPLRPNRSPRAPPVKRRPANTSG